MELQTGGPALAALGARIRLERQTLDRQSSFHRRNDNWPRLGDSRRPLLSLLLAGLIPLLLFGGWVTYLMADRERMAARQNASDTVRHVSERIASEMAAQLQVAETLAASTALDGPSLEGFYVEAQRVRAAHPLWATVELTDLTGLQALNLLRPLGAPLGPTADRESFDQVMRTRQSVVGGIGPVGQISGQRLVTIRAPVVRDDRLRYVLTVSFVPNAISSILKGAGTPKDWVGAVVDAKGNIIARTLAEEFELGRPASPGLRQAIAQAPSGSYVARTLEGVEVETVYQSLPYTGGWSVHLGGPSETLNAPVLRSIYVLAGGGVVSLLLALALAFLTARDIAHRRRSESERAALALAVSEERGAVAIGAAELGTWRWDAENGEVIGSGRTWDLLGLPHGLAGATESRTSVKNFLEAVHAEDRATVQAAIERCLKEGRSVNVAFRSVHPDKSMHWVRVTGRIPQLAGPAPKVIHGVIADIGAQKLAEAERLDLLRRLAEAQENEQRRIARELHDQVGQTVTGLSLGLKALEQKLQGLPGQEQVHWLRSLTSELGRDIHRAAADLRPTALDDLGLKDALLAFASDWSDRFGFVVDIQFVGVYNRLAPEIETVVYRVLQEALTNVLKHAQAHNLSIVLEQRGRRLHIIVEDDGVGCRPESISDIDVATSEERRSRPPLGLSGMRERLSLVNGTMWIESQPGEGTTLFIQIPLPEHELIS
ncbi:ATP-binding protein [Microvirga splendida]|uniref:ATP-binding protein n=1 Tax=Microvirga splendida TaxID=2795727 RepID=UPI001FEEFB03|nr:ATP-binding protein [Microvirga splendida]